MKIKVKTPAKINLSLGVGPLREDGFHDIESLMQSVSLFDYLTIELRCDKIILEGTSSEIPYDESNIAFRAAKLFFETLGKDYGAKIHIEKNIPVCAGLAGGSTNAAGVLWGLNKILDEPLATHDLHKMCTKLGSDVNFCLIGGRAHCFGRGENVIPLPFEEFPLTIIKPKNLTITAKEAYAKFDELNKSGRGTSNLPNDLEFALIQYYRELKSLHELGFQMSGSGPSFFIMQDKLPEGLIKTPKNYDIFEGLTSVPCGVCESD